MLMLIERAKSCLLKFSFAGCRSSVSGDFMALVIWRNRNKVNELSTLNSLKNIRRQKLEMAMTVIFILLIFFWKSQNVRKTYPRMKNIISSRSETTDLNVFDVLILMEAMIFQCWPMKYHQILKCGSEPPRRVVFWQKNHLITFQNVWFLFEN